VGPFRREASKAGGAAASRFTLVRPDEARSLLYTPVSDARVPRVLLPRRQVPIGDVAVPPAHLGEPLVVGTACETAHDEARAA